MGIRYLNRFLKENAFNSIKLHNLRELSGKTIAVDASIYMYRYASDNALIENIYLMLAIFRNYNIIPIFIFDGKPPPEKRELLQKRKEDKEAAEKEYKKLKQALHKNLFIDDNERQEIIYNMELLKKQFITINKTDIDNVKELITAYGVTYYDSPGEADILCATLTIKGKVWACLSEDMDMFVYGCPRVIRYLSLLNHTAVVYDMNSILNDLGVSQKQFREICVLSGTDYNVNYTNKNTLNIILKLFKKYYKSNSSLDFPDWIDNKYIQDYELFKKIYNMFDLVNNSFIDNNVIENITIKYDDIMRDKIKDILQKNGFIII